MAAQTAFRSTVSRETGNLLQEYCTLLRAWSPRINLLSSHDLSVLGTRHIDDCLGILPVIDRHSPATICDLGSGGGLPGVVVAICRPNMNVTMIEADARKATFLRHVRRELGLTCEIVQDRIEDASSIDAELVTARALAPLERLLPLVTRHLAEGGHAILPKGRAWRQEVEAARRSHSFEMDISHRGEGVILDLYDIMGRTDA